VLHGAELDVVDECACADDGAAHGIAVTVEVLGQGVDDQIGAVVEGAQHRWWGEGRVDGQ